MSLQLIVGPMFAGKSTSLIREFRIHKFLKRNILVVNHTFNQRYNSNSVTTHDHIVIDHDQDKIVVTDNLESVFERNDFMEIDVILIEELQFFQNAGSIIKKFVETYGKIIIASGLIATGERKPFGDVLELMLFADHIEHRKALCKRCCDGTEAPFSSRCAHAHSQTQNNAQNGSITIDVGAEDKYEALCRTHLLESHPELRE
jgi:thymidine kinase